MSQGRSEMVVPFFLWSVRLGVRTAPFHGANTGSNPVPTTTGPIVYRLGRLVFNQKRRVRLSLGLQKLKFNATVCKLD